jgi:hypothetical protein
MPAYSPEYLDIGWSMGIRYFDTAGQYGNGQDELKVAQWLAKYPERRKDLFLVSKDHPRQGPEQMLEMIDRRLARCGTTYLDLFFIHGISAREYGDASLDWPKSDAFKKGCGAVEKLGQVPPCGFFLPRRPKPAVSDRRRRGWIFGRDHGQIHAIFCEGRRV